MTTPVLSKIDAAPPGDIAAPDKKRKFEPKPKPLSEAYWASLEAEEAEEAEKAKWAKFFPSTPAPVEAEKCYVQEPEEAEDAKEAKKAEKAKWAKFFPVEAEYVQDPESYYVPEDERDWVPFGNDSDSNSDE